MTKFVLASALGLVLVTRPVAGAPPKAGGEATDADPSDATAAPTPDVATSSPTAAPEATEPSALDLDQIQAHDEVLPCGVRVVTARDEGLEMRTSLRDFGIRTVLGCGLGLAIVQTGCAEAPAGLALTVQ